MSALEYYQEYKQRKSNCGRHRMVLPEEQADYIRTILCLPQLDFLCLYS
jgi:hypothetical protein